MSATVVPVKSYLRIWLMLMLLLLLTWGAAQFNLGKFNLPAALTIAVLKMVLVVLFFMHVRSQKGLLRVFVIAGFVWLLIMIDLTLTDYLTRRSVPENAVWTWEHGAWPAPEQKKHDPR